MTDLFENLPENIKRRISEGPDHKEWKKCSNCGIYYGKSVKLRVCSGCVGTGGGAVYYCNEQCQTEHWPYHRKACLGGSLQTNRATKILSRWLTTHDKVLFWCLGQIYHYNPAIDPYKNFVCFYLSGDTMQLYKICVQPIRGHYLFPNFKPSLGPLATCYCLVDLDESSTHRHRGTQTLCTFYSKVLASPQLREQVVGIHNWHFVAASILSPSQLSLNAANTKLALLHEAIRRHTAKGTLRLEEKFLAPSVTMSVELPKSDLHEWYAMLDSIDLWKSFREPDRIVNDVYVLDEPCPLAQEIRNFYP
ncbi:hypothetical protein M408DRAFT_9680 [Serendipita vermifera MAFF 305830]|uniref:MYND-type domain-containing protein n=1 Tax=Serendipita vermifera MAFF 305830 TaxID=933852 RepID=A0A0C3B5T2_SERVB|nr:hypothetical protein M408DRAFT_9680 [Serendipita vermifera MAFF 305830]